MRELLDAHPNICCANESSIMRSGALKTGKLAQRFGFPESRVRDMARRSRSQTEFIDRFFEAYSTRAGKPRWADKSPRNVHRLRFIREHFPKSKFIHVLRDGRDVVCSLRTHLRTVEGDIDDRSTWNPIEPSIDRWVRDVSAGLVGRGESWYTEVRYEDLVAKPEETLRALFDFLGEPWDDAVLESRKVESEPRYDTKSPQNPETTSPIYKNAMERWRRDFTAEEIRVFKQRAAGSLLIQLGYVEDDRWGEAGDETPPAER
jgi:hypothetical protein